MLTMMKPTSLAPEVLMFVGAAQQSVATAFLHRDEVLLVDALGSAEDARALREVLCEEMGKMVRLIVSTHFMSDHIAGLALFPEALTIAHRHHRATFLSQQQRQPHDDAQYREPQLQFDGELQLRWGTHELRLQHRPGKTLDHLCVDVPSADLACVGDAIVGHIVYLSKADPALIRDALVRIRRLGRRSIVGGHIGSFPAAVLDHALHYLDRLRQIVMALRAEHGAAAVAPHIARIAIEDCLAPGVAACAFEREWHRHNLRVIAEQAIFSLDAAIAARELAA